MKIDVDLVSNLAIKYTTVPLITLVYLALTIILSAITSYVRTQSYHELSSQNPSLVFDDVVIPALQLVPSHIIFYPWTLWTSTYVETSPLQFIFGFLIVYFGVTFLESQWNALSLESENEDVTTLLNTQKPISETFKFSTFVVTLSNLACLLFTSLIYIINGTSQSLNKPLQYGLFILILPLSVVAKQLTPERNIKVFSLFKFRLKRSPFILLSFSVVLSIIRSSLSPFLPAFISFIITWYYLRYIQLSPAINSNLLPIPNSNSASVIRGDPSDTFSLVEFFPEMMKPTLKPAFDGFYQLAVLVGIVRAWNDDDVDIGNLRSNLRVSNTSKTQNGSANADERRKQIALKVLEQTVAQPT